MDWNKILNWRLLSGSHEFPGPDGGTCINEAAIVAAGFRYNSVRSADDCPPCFSRVLSSYAIALNDSIAEDRRQLLLMPFVTRFAGTADSPDVERQRFDHIVLGLIRTVLPISLRGGRDDLAAECEGVTDYDGAILAANNIARDLDRARALVCDLDCADALDLARDRDRALDYARAIDRARALARDLALALALDRALALDLAVVLDRDLDRDLDRARALDRARDLVCDLDRASARALALALAVVLARDPDRALDRARDRALDRARDQAAVSLLDGAMSIGKQADPVVPAAVLRRLNQIRKQPANVLS